MPAVLRLIGVVLAVFVVALGGWLPGDPTRTPGQ
jgi:hypothetical protein